jgi:hypothetical protein
MRTGAKKLRIDHIVLVLILLSLTNFLIFTQFTQMIHPSALIHTINATKGVNMSEVGGKPSSFTAKGEISSLTYLTEIPNNLTNTLIKLNSSSDLTDAVKFILSGDWNLEVKGGRLTKFAANFIQLLEDGGLSHSHRIINFVQTKDSKIGLSSDLWSSIKGTADVKFNGTTTWSEVGAEIIISKGKTITIILDNKATENHFQGQPIYGVVRSINY